MWMNLMQDGYTHVTRLIYLADNIRNLGVFGQLNSKVYFGMIDGAGYGYPLFYGDSLMYPFAICLNILGPSKSKAEILYKIYSTLSYIIQFAISFICVYKALSIYEKNNVNKARAYRINKSDVQLLISCVWIATPLSLSNLYYKTSQRTLASAFIILAMYSCYMIIEGCKNDDNRVKTIKYQIMLQLSMWVILTQHNITFIITVIILAVEVLTIVIVNKTCKIKVLKLIRALGIQIITFSLQSFNFVIPMLKALSSGIYVINNQRYNLQSQVNTDFRGLFFPDWTLSTLNYVLTGSYQNDVYMSTGYYGFYYTIFLIFGIYLIIKGKKSLGIANIAYVIVAYTVIYQKININRLQFMQYRFRLNTIFDIVMLVILVIDIIEVPGKSAKHLRQSVIFVSVISQILQIQLIQTAVSLEYNEQIQIGNGGEYLVYNEKYVLCEDETIQYNTNKQVNDIINYIKSFKDNIDLERVYDKGEFKQLINIDRDQEGFKVISNDNMLQLPYIYYDGYNIKINGNDTGIQIDELGLIQVDISNYDCQTLKIEVNYSASDFDKLLSIIQILTILMQVTVYMIMTVKKEGEQQ